MTSGGSAATHERHLPALYCDNVENPFTHRHTASMLSCLIARGPLAGSEEPGELPTENAVVSHGINAVQKQLECAPRMPNDMKITLEHGATRVAPSA